jgi:hypothetical protein
MQATANRIKKVPMEKNTMTIPTVMERRPKILL